MITRRRILYLVILGLIVDNNIKDGKRASEVGESKWSRKQRTQKPTE
jgi:hypothetical protein